MPATREQEPRIPRLPAAPRSIPKGSSLGDLLDREAIECLIHNLSLAYPQFDGDSFRRATGEGLAPLKIRGRCYRSSKR